MVGFGWTGFDWVGLSMVGRVGPSFAKSASEGTGPTTSGQKHRVPILDWFFIILTFCSGC
jgi:hypothetical protein